MQSVCHNLRRICDVVALARRSYDNIFLDAVDVLLSVALALAADAHIVLVDFADVVGAFVLDAALFVAVLDARLDAVVFAVLLVAVFAQLFAVNKDFALCSNQQDLLLHLSEIFLLSDYHTIIYQGHRAS